MTTYPQHWWSSNKYLRALAHVTQLYMRQVGQSWPDCADTAERGRVGESRLSPGCHTPGLGGYRDQLRNRQITHSRHRACQAGWPIFQLQSVTSVHCANTQAATSEVSIQHHQQPLLIINWISLVKTPVTNVITYKARDQCSVLLSWNATHA